jgi:transposase-like protein
VAYSLSYRDLEELMQERGYAVDHSTVHRWVVHYAPRIEKACPVLNAILVMKRVPLIPTDL